MKKILIICLFLFFFFSYPTKAWAALVNVDNQGNITWNVLSAQMNLLSAKKADLEIKDVTQADTDENLIVLEKTGEKIYLNNYDVTQLKDLVEIEERGEVKKVQIGIEDGKFVIQQEELKAVTEFPLAIDASRNEFAVKTPSGSVYLLVLPIEAAESALRSRFISQLADTKLKLLEKGSGILTYQINGEKVLDVFNFFDYKIPVTAYVSATTGELISVEGPDWFKIFGFLFS